MDKSEKTLIVITGPTASGKSALSVSLAKTIHTEIISADSRQIFRHIPIVTAVPTVEERQGIVHHLIETHELDQYYSAAKFQEDASQLINEIFQNNDFAIVCGGSMLYIDSLLNGIDELPTVPAEIRQKLMIDWKREGDEWLLDRLKELDRDYYQKTDKKNLKRVFHAVELSLTAGQPYSSLLTGRENIRKELPYKVIKICLNSDREKLFSRINRRVVSMMEKGLEDEARSVYHLRHMNSLNTVGLKEMFAYFEGKLSREEAISRIQKNTRVYAKKQLTWHKRDNSIFYLDFDSPEKENLQKILKML